MGLEKGSGYQLTCASIIPAKFSNPILILNLIFMLIFIHYNFKTSIISLSYPECQAV